MRRNYRWFVFVGFFIIVAIFSTLTRSVLDEYGLSGFYRVLITLVVALAISVLYFQLAGRLRR